MTERILSLDISSKTGWAIGTIGPEGLILLDYGRIDKTSEPYGTYPANYVLWAYKIFSEILQLIELHHPDILVIEETSKGSKNAMSQKILEYTHFLLARLISETGIKSFYFQTEAWRRIIGCKMSKEDKLRNKDVKDQKKKTGKSIAYDINGKRIGKIGRKHLNVRRANEIFKDFLIEPLIMADEDKADALGLLSAYHIKELERK